MTTITLKGMLAAEDFTVFVGEGSEVETTALKREWWEMFGVD